ncbi:MAG: hypothetical protein KatS3mg059_1423 [Thermomicrobiales bacterium]|nr:MAG: hypothetical protein KatS3mg059_1423 [Thermomicrobiales bacterium]
MTIPGFLVEAVVEAPRGAWPCSCAGWYGYDEDYLRAYRGRKQAGEEAVLAVFGRACAPARPGRSGSVSDGCQRSRARAQLTAAATHPIRLLLRRR